MPMMTLFGLNNVTVDPPSYFTGERRDWTRFHREAMQYDLELRTNGYMHDGARVRALVHLLDESAATRVKAMQAEANQSGIVLTLEKVMAELNKVFSPR